MRISDWSSDGCSSDLEHSPATSTPSAPVTRSRISSAISFAIAVMGRIGKAAAHPAARSAAARDRAGRLVALDDRDIGAPRLHDRRMAEAVAVLLEQIGRAHV